MNTVSPSLTAILNPSKAIFWSTTLVALAGNVTVFPDKFNVLAKSSAPTTPEPIFALVTASEAKSAFATVQFAILALFTEQLVIPFVVTFDSGI